MYTAPRVPADVFVRELLRRGCSLEALRNLLWAEVVDEWPAHLPRLAWEWDTPPSPYDAPDPREQLERVLAAEAPETAALIRDILGGAGMPAEASLELMVARGLPPHALSLVMKPYLDEYRRFEATLDAR
jgi:hypothetical protein